MRLIVIAKMDNSPSLPSSATTSRASSKLTHTHDKNKDTADDVITINEKIILTKQQHQVLKIICDTYQTSFTEYMQQALVEAMSCDIEEGNFCDALLEKIGEDDGKKDNSSSCISLVDDLMKNDLDLLKKLQMQT